MDIEIGNVYKRDKKDAYGCLYVQIEAIAQDGSCLARTGVVSNKTFYTRTFFDANTYPVRRVRIGAAGIAALTFQFNQKGENKTMNNQDANETQELTYETDEFSQGAEAQGDTGARRQPLTAEQQKQAIEDAARLKKEAIDKAEKEKADARRNKQISVLTDLAEKAGATLPEVSDLYAPGIAVGDFDANQFAAAKEGLKEAGKTVKTNKKKLEKAVEKLNEQIATLGISEADAMAGVEGKAAFSELTLSEAEALIESQKEAVSNKKKETALALRTALTEDEQKEFATCDAAIKKALPQFQTLGWKIGAALSIINSKRLYRNHTNADGSPMTFAEFVMTQYDLSRPHAYSVMNAAQTFEALSGGENFNAKQLPSITAAEGITRGVTGLLKEANVSTEDAAEVKAITQQMARNVYDLAVSSAPVDKAGAPILSPSHLQSVFSVLNDVARTGVVEMDGVQVPVNLAAASIDEMITDESAERVKRAKQFLADRFAAQQQVTKAPKAAAASNGTSGNGLALPAEVKPKLTVICSFHGRVEVKETTEQDLTLACGCVFVSTPDGYLFEKNTAQTQAA
jgi:hypothetical protein